MQFCSLIQICIGVTLRLSDFLSLSVQFFFWTPNYQTKLSDLQVGRVNTFHILQTIRNGPLNFKLCMKRPLNFQISKFWVRSFVPWPQIIEQKCHQIYSTVKFVEQNFHFPILSRNLYGRYLKNSKFMSSEYVVLCRDPKLLDKSATRFILRWNFVEQNFHSPILGRNLYGRYP
jgi:hypothetical protein